MTLKDFVIEAVSRGRNTKRYIELSPDMDIWEWIDNLRKTGLEEEHTADLFVEPVPGKIYVGRFSNTGEWFLKFIAGSMRLKVFFHKDGKFENIYSKKAKIASWTFRKDVGPCIAEINYWLPEMVKEAVSGGSKRTRYIDGESIQVAGTTCKEFLELLRDIEGTELVPLDPGKDYGYSKDTLEGSRDIRYLFQYAKDRFNPGQVIWHRFGRSDKTVLVYLSDGSSNLVGEVFILDYRGGDKIRSLQKAEAKKSKGMGGVDTWYIEDSKKPFLNNMERLEDILAKAA